MFVMFVFSICEVLCGLVVISVVLCMMVLYLFNVFCIELWLDMFVIVKFDMLMFSFVIDVFSCVGFCIRNWMEWFVLVMVLVVYLFINFVLLVIRMCMVVFCIGLLFSFCWGGSVVLVIGGWW